MEQYYLKSFLIIPLIFLFAGCGDAVRPNENLVTDSIFVEVERGAVLYATVKDVNGVVAKDYNNSNIYLFDTLPTYPLVASGGVIKIANDTNKTVLLDINMSSYTNNITPITTILTESNRTKRAFLEEKLMGDFTLTKEELYSIPSKKENTNLAVLTNHLYKKAKENNTTLENIYNYTNNTTLKSEFDSFKAAIQNNSTLMVNGAIDSLKLENYLYEQNSSLFTKLQDVAKIAKKEFLTTNNIEDIWKISFPIKNQNFSNIKIGVKIIKYETDGTPDIGEFVYSGVDITNGTISNPTRLDVYGKGDSDSGATWYDKLSDTILQNGFELQNGVLTLNIGNAMKQQRFVSENTFKVATTYDITITSSENIFLYGFPMSLNLIYNQYKFEAKEGMSGEIVIK